MEALTLNEAAALLNMPVDMLVDKARGGEIPGAEIGRQWVFLKIDLMALILQQSRQPGYDVTQAKKSSHTRPKAPTISLDQPGRLRVAHVENLLGISHATLYAGMKKGRYPRPDGYDGKLPYWKTETIRLLLEG